MMRRRGRDYSGYSFRSGFTTQHDNIRIGNVRSESYFALKPSYLQRFVDGPTLSTYACAAKSPRPWKDQQPSPENDEFCALWGNLKGGYKNNYQ